MHVCMHINAYMQFYICCVVYAYLARRHVTHTDMLRAKICYTQRCVIHSDMLRTKICYAHRCVTNAQCYTAIHRKYHYEFISRAVVLPSYKNVQPSYKNVHSPQTKPFQAYLSPQTCMYVSTNLIYIYIYIYIYICLHMFMLTFTHNTNKMYAPSVGGTLFGGSFFRGILFRRRAVYHVDIIIATFAR